LSFSVLALILGFKKLLIQDRETIDNDRLIAVRFQDTDVLLQLR
jgi:hypothetical protein